ncbi:hypothetical protein T07_7834, partial [Trichinella nelsoni]
LVQSTGSVKLSNSSSTQNEVSTAQLSAQLISLRCYR